MVMHKFLIHNKGDDVGVATEDIGRGEEVTGVYMDTEETITLSARGDIPLSHKIAVNAIVKDGEVTEYRVKIGLAKEPIAAGDYVHVHNIRSARWSFEG
ncbi:MAG: UxaA family hydrolase [Gemmatimonadota bacterium]|nr:MAG: UxaA family hydrolase [Gemmatimonadota bacterium]